MKSSVLSPPDHRKRMVKCPDCGDVSPSGIPCIYCHPGGGAEQLVTQLEASLPAQMVTMVRQERMVMLHTRAVMAELELIFCDNGRDRRGEILARLHFGHWTAELKSWSERMGDGNRRLAWPDPTVYRDDENVLLSYLLWCSDMARQSRETVTHYSHRGPAALMAAYEYRCWMAQVRLVDEWLDTAETTPVPAAMRSA